MVTIKSAELSHKIRRDGRENPPSDLDKNGDLRYDRKHFTVEWYRSGYNGPDSKSGDGQPSVGSNPTRSAIDPSET